MSNKWSKLVSEYRIAVNKLTKTGNGSGTQADRDEAEGDNGKDECNYFFDNCCE